MSAHSSNPVEFCRQLAAPRGSANYYATLYVPTVHQPTAWAVLALRHELNDVVTRIAEPSVALARLDWWQSELAAAAQGSAQHPIAQALAQHVLSCPGHDALLDEMLTSAHSRLHPMPIDHASDFALLSYRADIAPWMIFTDPDGQAGRLERNFAHAVGTALTWSRVLHYLGRDAAQGEVFIPKERLHAHGLSHTDFMQPRTNERVRRLLAELGRDTRQHIDYARRLLAPAQQGRQIMALVSLTHAEALLDAMQREDWNLLELRPELTPLKMFWLAWRTAGQARRGKIKSSTQPNPCDTTS